MQNLITKIKMLVGGVNTMGCHVKNLILLLPFNQVAQTLLKLKALLVRSIIQEPSIKQEHINVQAEVTLLGLQPVQPAPKTRRRARQAPKKGK